MSYQILTYARISLDLMIRCTDVNPIDLVILLCYLFHDIDKTQEIIRCHNVYSKK